MADAAESSGSAAEYALAAATEPGCSNTKTVLVSFKDRKRPVVFAGGVQELQQKVFRQFSDVLPQGLATNIYLQIKDESWGTEVDIIDQDIPDGSIIKVGLCDSAEVESTPSSEMVCPFVIIHVLYL